MNYRILLPLIAFLPLSAAVEITGERKLWHKITLTLDGPRAKETDVSPNPFLDYRMTVTFTHSSGSPEYKVPGYFAADGNAARTSAAEGGKWRAHFAPDKTGGWRYRVSFVGGPQVAVEPAAAGTPVAGADGRSGSLNVAASDKKGRDFRAHGRLQYAGGHYLRFAGSGEYFLKAGSDSPETLLAYRDFDGTSTRKTPLKTYEPHLRDWRPGDPGWAGGEAGAAKGKGLTGALNYLADKGLNAISFLTYNAGGDGDNVWPFPSRDDKLHYDCSKLDQWQIVFDHAQARGLYLHFKLQETENDDTRRGENQTMPEPGVALDGGATGIERKLYLRELVARFGHLLALNWNLGEENSQTAEEQRAMAAWIHAVDPYHHHLVVHTFPNRQEQVYPPLLGAGSVLTGASLQNGFDQTHERTLRWRTASRQAGKPWVIANDEQGSAALGVPPDPGYAGFEGKDPQGKPVRTLHDIRRYSLWGNLMAGGAGVEYYFGYQLPQNDLLLEDFRSRERSWDYCRFALEFFRREKIPFAEMENQDALVGNPQNDNSRYCFAKPGAVYLAYLPLGGSAELDLAGAAGEYEVRWYNPRAGGALAAGSVSRIRGGAKTALGAPPADPGEDWLAVVRAVRK